MRLLIAVPTFENIKPETFKSIYDLDTSGFDCTFEYVKGYDCAAARNKIAKKAIEGGYDFVLMVDSDTVVPSNALQVMSKCNAGIVLAFQQRRNGKRGESTIFKDEYRPYYKRDLDREYMPAMHGGMGCALIAVDVFKHLEFPYFQYIWDSEVNLCSEDIYFCDKARAICIKVMAANVWCGHVLSGIDYGE